jgi:hypothetical protein
MISVIALIALIAAILLPVLQTARKRGRAASCLSQVRQVGIACLTYAQDYDGIFPVALNPSDPIRLDLWREWSPRFADRIPALPQLHTVIGVYIKTPGLLRCPSDSGLRVDDIYPGWRLTAASSYETFGTSYFYNSWIAACQGKVSDPSETGVVFDANGAWHGDRQRDGSPAPELLLYNIVYADSHARARAHSHLAKVLAVRECN